MCTGLTRTSYHLQNIYLVIIQSLTSGRPGEFVVSGASGYYNSNNGLEYGDHKVDIIPNPSNPHRPHILTSLTVRNLKGHLNNESRTKTVVFYPETTNDHAMCPVRLFLALALMDGAFQHVSTIEEIMSPIQPCLKPHTLSWKPTAVNKKVLRVQVCADGVWTIS